MWKQWMRGVIVVAVLATSGCAGIGTLGDVLGGLPGTGSRLAGEVRRVDQRRQAIQIRTYNGRTETVAYDRSTEVVYRRQRYPVRALEPGDQVSLQLRRGRRGGLYADRIYVERSVQERRGGRYPTADRNPRGGREQLIQGRVGRIDRQRGWFELHDPDRGRYMVTLPYDPSSSTLSRFRRLRGGERVRVEGLLLDRGRVELRRFR